MVVYLANMALILVLGICLIYIQPTQQKRKVFCWLSSVSWILISGLRSWSVGADTLKYAEHFDRAGSVSWADAFTSFYRGYLQGYTPEDAVENFWYKDPGYLLFQKIAHILTDDYQVYLIIIAVIFFSAMGRFVYKNSEDPCFSYILFSVLFYSFYAVTGHRQTLATALIVFVGYELIKERKLWKFILITLVAFLLHKSVLLFAPFYFLSRIKISGKYLAVLGGFTAVIFALGGNAILWIASLVGYNREEAYEAPTYTFTALMVLLTLVVLLCFRQFKNKTPYKNMEVLANTLAAMFALFTLLDQSMMRVQQYYSLMTMLTLPSAFSTFKPKNKLLVTMLCMLALLFLFIKTGAHYKFFWQ